MKKIILYIKRLLRKNMNVISYKTFNMYVGIDLNVIDLTYNNKNYERRVYLDTNDLFWYDKSNQKMICVESNEKLEKIYQSQIVNK